MRAALRVVAFSGLVTAVPVTGQTIGVATYPFSSASGVTLEDMSTATALLAAGSDDVPSPVTDIGFDLWFLTSRYTRFSVNSNGLLQLGNVPVTFDWDNATGFASAANNPKLAPYFDDLAVGTNGDVRYKVMGAAGSRKLVVEWRNMTIPYAPGAAGAATFQAWLFETSGLIEFVYGPGMVANSGQYSVGIANGATNFASVSNSGPTVSYVTADNAQTGAIADGTAYLFTPPSVAAPTNLTFTGVTTTAMTLNWTDSGNETAYAVLVSTDGGASYTFATMLPQSSTTFSFWGAAPATTYGWIVRAVSSGAVADLEGSQATLTPTLVSSTPVGGSWSDPATWSGSVVPVSDDDVTIAAGATVTIDTAAVATNVTVAGTAILQFEPTTARKLTLGADVTIQNGGTFRSALSGTQIGHVLSLGRDLTNDGTLDFSTNGNTAGAVITFTGLQNSTFSGSGAVTNIRQITLARLAPLSGLVDLRPDVFTVQGATDDSIVGGWLVMGNGALAISGTFAGTSRVFATSDYIIPSGFAFWLDNPDYTVAPQAASVTNDGVLRLTQGTINIGTSANHSVGAGGGATFVIEGGVVNIAGRISTANAVTWSQSGGTVNVATVGNSTAGSASFGLTSSSSSFGMSGGTIVLHQASTAGSSPIDYQVAPVPSASSGTVQVGSGATAGSFTFRIRGHAPNLVIDATTNPKNAVLVTTDPAANTAVEVDGNTTIQPGSSLSLNGYRLLVVGSTFTNDGTVDGTTAWSWLTFAGSAPQTYAGSGTCALVGSGATLYVDNPSGLTFSPSTTGIVARWVIMRRGNVTNANKITLGDGGFGAVYFGQAGAATAAGTFDVAPTFNLAFEAVYYLNTTAPRATGPEIPPSRVLDGFQYGDFDPSHALTISGGDLTVRNALLSAGRVVTGANTFIIRSTGILNAVDGFVDGNLRQTFTAAASKAFPLGTANGKSPVTVNVNSGTFPAAVTVKATQATMPGIVPADKAITRYWTLAASGITADLTFSYLDLDVPGTATEASLHLYRHDAVFTDLGGTLDTTLNTASISGVTTYSDWTLAEPGATPVMLLRFDAD